MPYQPKKPINEMTMDELIEDLRQRKEYLRKGGDPKVQEKMHKEGMLNARERIDKLLDPGTFVEIDMFVTHHSVGLGMEGKDVPADGIITGYGEIDGRGVYLYSQDYSVMSGAVGRWGGSKLVRMYDLAYAKGVPVIAICHGTGARLQEAAWGNSGGGVACNLTGLPGTQAQFLKLLS
jgi:acetyl-CoA carboxylase carboxyltransferase component